MNPILSNHSYQGASISVQAVLIRELNLFRSWKLNIRIESIKTEGQQTRVACCHDHKNNSEKKGKSENTNWGPTTALIDYISSLWKQAAVHTAWFARRDQLPRGASFTFSSNFPLLNTLTNTPSPPYDVHFFFPFGAGSDEHPITPTLVEMPSRWCNILRGYKNSPLISSRTCQVGKRFSFTSL